MKAKKILFVTQEITPYVPESELTPIGHDLPIETIEQNREIRAFMPKWGNINERRNQLHEVIRLSGMNITVNDTDHQLIIKVASIVGTRMQVYFIDNEDFFAKRLAEKDREGNEYTDNVERSAFYARGVLETVKKLRWTPDVVHCQGWVSALVPLYLKTAYADEPCFRDCQVIYTVSDSQLTFSVENKQLQDIVNYRNADGSCFKEFGDILTPNQLQLLAIKYADGINIYHPNAEALAYAQTQKKPILEGRPMNQAYIDFYDLVWSNNHKSHNEV